MITRSSLSLRRSFRWAEVAITATLALAVARSTAATWYVSPTGSDTNGGTASSPFATIMQAQSAASSGDIVYLYGGTYVLPNSYNSLQDSVYAAVNLINKSGITYEAIPGGTLPVFDFSNVNPTGYRVAAFWVTASNVTFQGFDVIGVKENITTTNNQSLGFANYGCTNCTWNEVNVHDIEGTGFYFQKAAANNLVYRCDSYNNTGINSYSYGNADGFGCHPAAGGTGNVFRECRAWNNSDDGYDCLNSAESVTFDHCWSYLNGNNGGNGNGFKVGGWGCSSGTMPSVIPVHTVEFCLAANNASHNFYANHQPGQAANWYNNTSYNGAVADFDMLEGLDNGANCSVSGYREVLHNNIAYVGTLTKDDADPAAQETYNSWTESHVPTDADFQSVDATQMTATRNADGSLPDIAFMHLASTSPFIDAGTNLGFSYNGAAPDLGCFESGGTVSQPPGTPTNLTATAGNGQVVLSWTASSGATSYNVKRSLVSGGTYSTIASGVTSSSYTDASAVNGTTYYYVVSAVNSVGESADSAEVSATPAAPTVPAAPTGLTATGGKRKISLAWTAATGAITYNVKRSGTNGGPYTTIASGVTATTYTDSGVTRGTTYYYVVSGVNNVGEGANSNQASATAQ